MRMERELPEMTVKRLMDDTGRRVVEILDGAGKMNALEINKAAKELEAFDKNKILEISRLRFRDVMVYKSTADNNRLFFYSDKDIIKQLAADITWEGLNRITKALENAADRLDASVKAEAVYESMLLDIRMVKNDKSSWS